ncbi:hypothetical protein LLH23_05690 [bacterium]|nr:hypothetical protein [bacterium]
MSLFTIGGKPQPFPELRPDLRVEPLDRPAPELHWREVRNGFSRLQIGDHTMWTMYDPPDWRLTYLMDVHMIGKVELHGVEGLELQDDEYDHERDWQVSRSWTFIAATAEQGRWLGTDRRRRGVRVLRTFLDEGFDDDWGSFALVLRDTGRFARQADGALAQRHTPDDPDDRAGVLGMAKLTVGERKFECVHVIDVPAQPTERDALMECFVRPDDGRLIICRRYNGRLWGHGNKVYADRGPWDEHLPDAQRLVVDGVPFIHWYDCLGHIAVGVDPDDYAISSS